MKGLRDRNVNKKKKQKRANDNVMSDVREWAPSTIEKVQQ